STLDATNISSAALIRAGAATHAFDMDQRMIGLNYTVDAANNAILLNAPANGNLAPPGYYMLFLLNSAGVPSVANFVRVLASDYSLAVNPGSQQVSQGGNTSFTATVTPQTGFSGTVSLGLSGLPSGITASFSAPALTSGDSTLNVSIGNSVAPGTYPFTITSTSGSLSHSANVSLMVQASADFALSVTPASRKIFQNGKGSFTATVSPQNGFSEMVVLGATGLPAGVTASFKVPQLRTGNSMLNVIVGADVAPGDYPFTITGVSGSLIHTANAVLTVLVQGKYTVSITPPAQTVSR